MDKIKVKLSDREVDIYKLPLKRYVELLNALKELPKKFQNVDKQTNEEFIAKLPEIIAGGLPEVVRVLEIATDLKEEYIMTLGLDEVVDLVIAVVKVNQYREIIQRVKNELSPVPATKPGK